MKLLFFPLALIIFYLGLQYFLFSDWEVPQKTQIKQKEKKHFQKDIPPPTQRKKISKQTNKTP